MGQMDGIHAAELSRCLFNEANDAFLIVDPTNLRLLDVNATVQRLTGWRKKMLLAMKLDELLEGVNPDSTRRLLRACHSTQFFHSEEGYSLRRSDGPPLAMNVTVSRIHGESVTLGLVVVRDVSERKQAEESLRETNERLQTALNDLKRSQEVVIQQERMRALGQMASGASHELNNLLTPLVGYSELLLGRSDLSPDVCAQLVSISTAAHDAADVIGRLQMVHDRSYGQTETLDLKELLRQIPDLTRPKWRSDALRKGREVVLDLELNDVPPVQGNPSELRQVVTNLVFNAVEAMPEGGCITLRLRTRSEGVLVEVADTGHGMNEEQQRRCFDPFFTTKDRGAGLGLSVCHGIVGRHGGSIDIDSETGRGTTVTVILPSTDYAADEAVSKKEGGSTPSSASELRILYIDDDEAVRDALAVMFRSLHFHADLAENGADGLAMFQSADYDVVITDLGMAGIDGKEVTRAVKEARPQMPVVLISGWGESVVREEFDGHVKPDFILSKPTRLGDLLETLRQIRP